MKKNRKKRKTDVSDEGINGEPLAKIVHKQKTVRVSDEQKLEHFGKTTGLHSSYDETKRYEIELQVIEHTLRVETVTDWETGLSLRADTLDYGPPRSQMTWAGLNYFIHMKRSI